jgi:hypothetical protein
MFFSIGMRPASSPSQRFAERMGRTMKVKLIAVAIAIAAGSSQGLADSVIALTNGEMDQVTAGSATTVVTGWGSAIGSEAGASTSALINNAEGYGSASALGLDLYGSTGAISEIGTGYTLIQGVQGKIASTATGSDGVSSISDGTLNATVELGTKQTTAVGTTTVSAQGQKAVTVVETDISVPGVQIGARTTSEAEPSEDGVTLVSTTEFLLTIDRSATSNAGAGNAGGGTGGNLSGLTPASGGGTTLIGGSRVPSAATQRWGGDWAGPAVCLSCR